MTDRYDRSGNRAGPPVAPIAKRQPVESKPILVVCVICAVVFDLRRARHCGDANVHAGAEQCFVCPLGHKGHDAEDWWKATRRDPTPAEREAGILWMLPDYEVRAGVPLPRDDARAERLEAELVRTGDKTVLLSTLRGMREKIRQKEDELTGAYEALNAITATATATEKELADYRKKADERYLSMRDKHAEAASAASKLTEEVAEAEADIQFLVHYIDIMGSSSPDPEEWGQKVTAVFRAKDQIVARAIRRANARARNKKDYDVAVASL